MSKSGRMRDTKQMKRVWVGCQVMTTDRKDTIYDELQGRKGNDNEYSWRCTSV